MPEAKREACRGRIRRERASLRHHTAAPLVEGAESPKGAEDVGVVPGAEARVGEEAGEGEEEPGVVDQPQAHLAAQEGGGGGGVKPPWR